MYAYNARLFLRKVSELCANVRENAYYSDCHRQQRKSYKEAPIYETDVYANNRFLRRKRILFLLALFVFRYLFSFSFSFCRLYWSMCGDQ